MGETKSMFVGIAIGILLASIGAVVLFHFFVSDLDNQVDVLAEEIANISDSTQQAYDIGFNYGVVYVANYTTLTGNFTYIEDEEINVYSIEDYCDLNNIGGK